jgi:DHA2 family multidrug resistance protein
MLIIARILQGAGGGALQPISQAVLLESFPPQRRGVAMAVFGLGVVVAPIIGPTLGGWMTDNYSWRWVFYINLPIGVLAILMVRAFIEDPPYIRAAKPGRIDFIGFALLAIWIAAFQIVLDKGQEEDWLASSFIRWLIAVTIVSVIVFIWWEWTSDEPLVDLRVLANRNFGLGTSLMAIVGGVLYGTTALLPLFLQTLLNYPALQSGLTLSPRGFGSIAGMLIVGRIIGLIDMRILIAVGFAILTYATYVLGTLNLNIASSNVTWPNVFNGFGTALIFVPLTTLTMGTLRNEQIGNATGIFNLMRNLGGSVGISMMTTLLARRAQAHQALMVGHLTPYSPEYQQALAALTARLGYTPGSSLQAQGLIYAELLRQANLWAYIDNFRLMAFFCLCCIPFVLLFKRAKPASGPALAH